MSGRTLVSVTAIVLLYSLRVLGADRSDETRPSCHLNVGSQPLEGALQEVARQCAVQILFFSEITTGRTATELRGQYAIDEALHRLLDDTGLSFHHVNAATIQIQRAVAVRPTAKQNGARLQPANAPELQEIVVAGTAEGLVATRIETPLRDIPQTISVISAEQIRQQNNFDLGDALDDAIGMTAIRKDSLFQNFYSRGFLVTSFTLDHGGALRPFHEFLASAVLLTPDLSEFDHIEVLRGADALFGADAAPGGAIDLVRKRPLHETTAMFASSAGSWNSYRQEVDVTGPLALDGALRARLDVSYAHRDYFYDHARDERKTVFGALDYDLTENTLVTLGGSYTGDHALPFEIGLPLLSTGADPHLPRSTGYAFDWSHYNTQIREAYARLTQRFGTHWRLKVDATSLNGNADYAFARFVTPIDAASRGEPTPPFAIYTVGPTTLKQFNVEATLTGAVDWRGHHVEIAFGGDFVHSHFNSLVGETAFFGPPLKNAYQFDPADYPDPTHGPTAGLASRESHTEILSGLFASARVELTQPWFLTAGLRVSNQRTTNNDIAYFFPDLEFPTSLQYQYNGTVTPYVGTVFAIDTTYSVYASYADIYSSNFGALRSDGALVPPSAGIDMEAGVKGAWRDGAVNGSVTLYKIVQRGLALFDPSVEPFTSKCCYSSSGRDVSKGADLELTGNLVPGWLIGAGYTFSISKQVTPGSVAITPLYTQTPHHLFRLWTNFGPGSWYGWSVGGTLRAQSATYIDASACPDLTDDGCPSAYRRFRNLQKFYAVVSPRIGYQFDRRWQVALTVNNVFDRRYYESIGSANGGNWYGEPRNFLIRLDGRF